MARELGKGLNIELLGQFRVSVGDRAIDSSAWRRNRAATLIKLWRSRAAKFRAG